MLFFVYFVGDIFGSNCKTTIGTPCAVQRWKLPSMMYYVVVCFLVKGGIVLMWSCRKMSLWSFHQAMQSPISNIVYEGLQGEILIISSSGRVKVMERIHIHRCCSRGGTVRKGIAGMTTARTTVTAAAAAKKNQKVVQDGSAAAVFSRLPRFHQPRSWLRWKWQKVNIKVMGPENDERRTSITAVRTLGQQHCELTRWGLVSHTLFYVVGR